MKTMKKSIGLLVAALAFCMLLGVSTKVEAAAAPKSMKVAYMSTDRKDVSIEFPSRSDSNGYQVVLYNHNKKKIATTTCAFYASFHNKTTGNRCYYYRARVYNYINNKPLSGWSKLKAFSTCKKYALSQVKGKRQMYVKAPKIPGVKYYKVYMSAKRDSGYKALKKILPGKKYKITKTTSKKAFSYGKYYYLKFKPVLKKGGTAEDFLIPYFYFYRTYR